MTLQLLPSEFPYIWGKFSFLFYQCVQYYTVSAAICKARAQAPKVLENTSHPSGVNVQRFTWSYFKPTMNLHKNAQKFLLNRERRYTVRNVFSASWIAFSYCFSLVEHLRKMLFIGDRFSFQQQIFEQCTSDC